MAAFKTASKPIIQNTADATSDLIAIKTVNNTTKNSPVNDSQTEEKSIENIKEIYISPEKKSGNY